MAAGIRTTIEDRPSFRCTECGRTTARWLGRCAECRAWGTVEEVDTPAVRTTAPGRVMVAARSTGVPELDRVLGGGLVPGAVVLLAGEPGVGKSTLLPNVAAKASSAAARTLDVTGEELAGQMGCAPTASARCPTTSISWPRPISPPSSAISTTSSPRCSSWTRCRPWPPRRSTECRAA